MGDLEQAVHDELAALAARAPEPGDLVGDVRRRVRRRRAGIAMGSVAMGSVGVVVVVAVVAAVVRGPSLPPVADGRGEVSFGGAGSCHEGYSPETLPHAVFAFDGTVTGLGRPVSGGDGSLHEVGVTFRVNHWFRGGAGGIVTVDLSAPVTVNQQIEDFMSYGVGTRLLVSGSPRWGGAPLDRPIAWSCGFTRYWDAQTAAIWTQALG